MAALTAEPSSGLTVVFVCQAVDSEDPVLASTIRWIRALAARPEVRRVTVLALRTGPYDLPPEVQVRRFGAGWLAGRLVRFYAALARSLRPRPSLFFIYQGGPYPLLLLPLKLLMRTPIVQWKAHPAISRSMAFYARWCDDLVFTSTASAFPADLPKVRVVGQGIDTDVFRIEERPREGELVTACRISPRKRIEEMVEAVVRANRRFGSGYRFDVYGPTLPGDETYAQRLEALIDRRDARSWIRLRGPVSHDELPRVLNGYRAFVNFAETALDRSVVEAMACGLPVVSTNDSVVDIMPPELHDDLIADKRDVERQAETIHALLARPEPELAELGRRVRAEAVDEHGIERLFDRIIDETRSLL
jgi:glycosyltransferase involved in cell wall biosynthesis